MGLNGFFCFVPLYNPAITIVTTSLTLSTGSLVLVANLRYIGRNPHQSHILSIVDRGSKILTGNEIPTTLFPSMSYFPAYLIRSTINPSYKVKNIYFNLGPNLFSIKAFHTTFSETTVSIFSLFKCFAFYVAGVLF
jgi:hypothetical protein